MLVPLPGQARASPILRPCLGVRVVRPQEACGIRVHLQLRNTHHPVRLRTRLLLLEGQLHPIPGSIQPLVSQCTGAHSLPL